MSGAATTQANKRLNERFMFRKPAIAIFDGEPQEMVKTMDISATGVGIISPHHGLVKSACWLRLKLPTSATESLQFDVKTVVMYSIYSNEKKGFKVGLKFINPPPQMIEAINNIAPS